MIATAGARLFRASALAILIAAAAAPGCGVKGPPRPVEDTAALAPEDFSAARSAEGVLLRWSRPEEAVDGEPLYDLAGFDVDRRAVGDRRFERLEKILTADTDRLRPKRSFRYTDTTAGPTGVYEYRVRAFRRDGQRGLPTPTVTVDMSAPPVED